MGFKSFILIYTILMLNFLDFYYDNKMKLFFMLLQIKINYLLLNFGLNKVLIFYIRISKNRKLKINENIKYQKKMFELI